MNLIASSIVLAGGILCFGVIKAQEPVIGGPCEGCEWVFVELPEQLASVSRIAPVGEPGEAMVISGTVRTEDGTAAEGIIVYAYHTNAEGIYPRGATRHGRLRGWARTGRSGEYRFDTIRPGAYPGRDDPEHVHMHVIEPGKATYNLDDIVFSDDPLLTVERRKAMHGRGGDGLCVPSRDSTGVWHVKRDITLGRNIPHHDAITSGG